MDWNSGVSPLDAWLNQSAIPYTAPTVDLQEEKRRSRKDSVAQEIEEIKIFRNVHMAIAPAPANGQHPVAIDAIAELEVDTQIYYRNIVDRYPDLPSYLALRLARANRDRAERLRQQKIRGQTSQVSSDLDGEDYHGNSMSPARQTMTGKPNASIFNAQKKHKCKIYDKRLSEPALYKHICIAILVKSVSKKAAASYRGIAKINSSLCFAKSKAVDVISLLNLIYVITTRYTEGIDYRLASHLQRMEILLRTETPKDMARIGLAGILAWPP